MVKVAHSAVGISKPGVEDAGSSGDGVASPGEDSERDVSANPAVLQGAAAQASYQLRQLENSISPEDSSANDPSLTRIGTLNVGDSHAAPALNSAETVRAARERISATDRLELSVPGSVTSAPSPVGPLPPSYRPSAFHSTSSGYVAFPLEVADEGGDGETDLLWALTRPSGISGSSPAPQATGGATPTSAVSSSPRNQRYVFEVRDVHSMGGTPSMLSIRDASGAYVGRYELPAGNSRLTVDLPPGNYTVEAQSGSRSVGGGGDNLDNFRVEAYSAGPTPGAGK